MIAQQVGCESYPGEQSQQHRSSTCYSEVRPLALGLHSKVGANFLESNFNPPAQREPMDDLNRVNRGLCTQQSLCAQLSERVLNEYPSNGHRRLARMIPERCLRAELHSPSNTVVPRERRAHPACIGTVQECPECGQTMALETRTPHLAGPARRSGFIECGVETQSGNEGDRMSHRLTEVEQVEGSIAAVGDHHDVSVGQPAAQLKYHPARPVGDLLMGFAYPEMVAFGGSERCDDRERPGSMRPGNVGEPHEAYPSQSTWP